MRIRDKQRHTVLVKNRNAKKNAYCTADGRSDQRANALAVRATRVARNLGAEPRAKAAAGRVTGRRAAQRALETRYNE